MLTGLHVDDTLDEPVRSDWLPGRTIEYVIVGAADTDMAAHCLSLIWISVKLGRRTGASCQHSIIREYMRDGHSCGHGSS